MMGYTIRIGEAVVETDLDERSACVTTRKEDGHALGAPLDSTGGPDSRMNELWPGYIVWGEAMATLGLSDVWYGDERGYGSWVGPSGEEHNALLAEHPGCQPLTKDHLLAFEAAERRWLAGDCVRMRYDSTVNGIGHDRRSRYVPYVGPTAEEAGEYMGRRARWLVWWTEWALTHCVYPSVSNS
jgi:hypothetical protein